MSGSLSAGKGYDWRYLKSAVAEGAENYYLSAVREHGEPPGKWHGRGAEALGLEEGSLVDTATMEALYENFYDVRDPRVFDEMVSDKEKPVLGRRIAKYRSADEIFADKLAAEPEATSERKAELMVEARKEQRKTLMFWDLTFSPVKSYTLLHAGLMVAAKQAREAGDTEREQAATRAADIMIEILEEASQAGIEEVNRLAGWTRVGYHGKKVGGSSTGRWMEAGGWISSSWVQHTSRNGDPQLHVHNPVANRQLSADGQWRSLDGQAILRARPAGQAVSARVLVERSMQRLGLEWVPRADGQGWEVAGVDPEQIAEFSSRRAEVSELAEQIAQAYERKHGYKPNALTLFKIGEYATKKSKKAKKKLQDVPSIDQELEAWEAQTTRAEIGSLAAIPGRALFRRGREQLAADAEQLAQTDLDRVIEAALADAQAEKSTFSRYELTRHISRHLPTSLGGLPAERVSTLLEEVTEAALNPADPAKRRVLSMVVADVVDVPEEFRLADGRSAFRDPTAQWLTTPDQLEAEDRFLASAVQTDAPAVDAAEAAELLGYGPAAERGSAPGRAGDVASPDGSGTDHTGSAGGAQAAAAGPGAGRSGDAVERPGSVPDQLRPGVSPAGDAVEQPRSAADHEDSAKKFAYGLGEDQVAAVYGVLTSGRRIDVLEGFAGTGKSYTVAKLADLWRQKVGARVVGLTTGQNAANVLQDEGLDQAFNITRWLGWIDRRKTRLQQGDLVVVDESSMVTTDHLTRIQQLADAAGAKVLLTGDSQQLAAPGAGGLMRLLAQRHGSHQLTQVRRFHEQWERDASIRLRAGDQSVLAEYDRRGRIRGGTAEQMKAESRDDYVAAYLQGRRSLIITSTNADAAEMSGMVRERLVELGRVAPEALADLRDGNRVGIGDRITARENDQRVRIGDQERELSNRDVLEVTGLHVDGRIQARLLDEDGRPGDSVLLKRDYVDQHVELAYAGTSHAAQGRTLDEDQPLIREGISRQELYVMLSRGRSNSVARVITDVEQADLRPETPAADESGADQQRPTAERGAEAPAAGAAPGMPQAGENQTSAPGADGGGSGADQAGDTADRHRPAPGQQRPGADRAGDEAERDPLGVLAQILETDQADETATERMEIEADRVTHMAHLGSMWTNVVKDELADRTTALLAEVLPEEVRAELDADSARGSVMAAARRAVLAGHDLRQTLAKASEAGWGHVRSVGQVLSGRIERIIGTGEAYAESWARITPRGLRNQQLADQVAAWMDKRVWALGERALADPPSYLVERLGEPPAEAMARAEWQARAGRVEAYREAYGSADSPTALPPAPERHSPEQRAAWMAASAALGRSASEAEITGARDGQLWSWRAEYERAARWAPPSVADQLGRVYHEIRDRTREAVLGRAQADQERHRGDAEKAQRLEAQARAAEELARAAADRRDRLEEVQAQREAWHEHTEQARTRAMAADAELHRRHEDLDLPPLHRPLEDEPQRQEAAGSAQGGREQEGVPQKIKGQLSLFSRSVREWAKHGLIDRGGPEQEDREAARQDELDLGLPPDRRRPRPAERDHDQHQRQAEQQVEGQEALFDAPDHARGVGGEDDLDRGEEAELARRQAEQVRREREEARRRQAEREVGPEPVQEELDLGLVAERTGERWLDRALEVAQQARTILQRQTTGPAEREAAERGDQERFRSEERYYDHLARREEAELARRQERQAEPAQPERQKQAPERQHRPPQPERDGPGLSL